MQPPKHIVIVAGEESGDLHAAHFVHELKTTHPELVFSGIGGQHMHDAGVELVSDLARFGVTGLSEVIRHLPVIHRAFKRIKAHLIAHQPALLILVDYPGFNLRLAKFAHQHLPNTRILYYISPQIWAWKANRIHTIRQCVDTMAVILPFEKKLYEHAGVPVVFVGHPLVKTLQLAAQNPVTRQDLGLPKQHRLIALLPGSRTHEIERHMPVLRDCAEALAHQISDLHFVIPIARTINPEQIKPYFANTACAYTLVDQQAVATVACSDFVIVASGTASLECALLQKPMCIIYKVSLFTYLAASQLIRVKYLGLCNLLANQMIVPELLQYDCNAQELTRLMLELLNNPTTCTRMSEKLQQLTQTLSTQQADCTIAELIVQELLKPNSRQFPH